MTISSQQGRQSYVGDDVTTAFPVPFKFFADSDLKVVKQSAAGVDATLALNIDYGLAGAGSDAGGTLTLGSALASGEKLTIILDPARLQLTDFVSNDAFPAEVNENGLDRLTQMAIRTHDLVERGIRVPDGDVSPLTALPGAAARANQFLRFDNNGNPEMATGIDQSQTLSRSVIGQFFYPTSAAEVSAGVTVVNPFEVYGAAARYDIAGDGATDDTAEIERMCAIGVKLYFPKTASGYGITGALALTGHIEFEPGAFFKCLGETLITVDGNLNASDLYVDANNQTVDECLIYLKSGDHVLYRPRVENIRGTGEGAYGIKVNIEGAGKLTSIYGGNFKQITDARSGAITGDEGFCGGIYIACETGSTMTADGRTVRIRDTYGEDIYTTQADGTTENASDYDADLIRVFVNDVTSASFLDSVDITILNTVARGVQKRAVKVSGVGNATIDNTVGYGTRSATQMSDIVFVADGRHIVVRNTKGFGKFDAVVKLDGSTFDADYCIDNTIMSSSQANAGCAIQATDVVGLKVTGVAGRTDCERLLRLNGIDASQIAGIVYNGTKTGTSPLLDIQNCDDMQLDATVRTTFSGAAGQVLYIQGSNRCIVDLISRSSFGGANGQDIRFNNCTDLTIRGYSETNKYNVFDEGTNSCVKLDLRVKQTGTNQAISIAGTDDLELNCSKLTGDWTGAAMTAGCVALTDVDRFRLTGNFDMLGLTDAGNDRGIVITTCTRGIVDVNTTSGGSDAELIRLAGTTSKIKVRSLSDGSKPVRFLSTVTDCQADSFGAGAIDDDTSSEVTVTNNISSW